MDLTHLRPLLLATLLAALGCGDNSNRSHVFSLAVSPSSQTVTLPSSTATTTYTATTAVTSGAAEPIALSVSGLPSGVTGAFSPATITGAGSSTLTLTVPSTSAPATTSFTVTGAAASGSHEASAALAICAPGPVTLAVTQKPNYACHEPYRATFVVTNKSCAAVTVTQVKVTGTTDPLKCTAAGVSAFPLSPAVAVGAGAIVTVFDLTGANFCCTSSPCPAAFTCDESFAFEVTTSAGVISAPAQSAHIDLGGCSGEVCR